MEAGNEDVDDDHENVDDAHEDVDDAHMDMDCKSVIIYNWLLIQTWIYIFLSIQHLLYLCCAH